MPSVSDHVRRDAEHAARSDIRVQIHKFLRRLDEQAKADISTEIERAAASGEAVDGTAIGREAAARAIASYMDPGDPEPAIDAVANELPAGSPDS